MPEKDILETFESEGHELELLEDEYGLIIVRLNDEVVVSKDCSFDSSKKENCKEIFEAIKEGLENGGSDV